VTEHDIAHQYLRIGIRIFLALLQHIRMEQIDLALGRLTPISSGLHLSDQTKAKQAQDTEYQYPAPIHTGMIIFLINHYLIFLPNPDT
jgi:hypothetical protein